MSIKPVLKMGDPRLLEVARSVEKFNTPELEALIRDMHETMEALDGAGLAASQIGVDLRAFCLDVTGHPKAGSCAGLVVLFDPEVVAAGAPAVAREGCMSVPDLTGNVARPATVAVKGTTPEGTRRLVEADAIEARALLHELDHLDGLLFLDRVVSASTDLFRRRRYR